MTVTLGRLVVGKDSNGSFVYTRNFSKATFQALYEVAGSDSIDLTQFVDSNGASIIPSSVIIGVSPGLQLLVSPYPITYTPESTLSPANGELVTSDYGFSFSSLEPGLNTLYIEIIGVPEGGGLACFNFFV